MKFEHHSTNSLAYIVQNLVDVDVFLRSRRILEELDKKNCELGLKFCADNRSRLRRIKVPPKCVVVFIQSNALFPFFFVKNLCKEHLGG